MKFIKINQRILVCFSAKELIELVFGEDLFEVVNLAVKKFPRYPQDEVVNMAEENANLRDRHEIYVAVLGLYQEFGNKCDFCFYLKDSFNYKKDKINNFDELVEAKTDPPDLIIYYQKNVYEFELKRYRGSLEIANMFSFLEEKILRYSNPLNFLIILQPPSFSNISFEVFEELSQKFKEVAEKSDINCRVCYSFNANNEEMIFVYIYPEYQVYKRPLVRGSEQIKTMLKGK